MICTMAQQDTRGRFQWIDPTEWASGKTLPGEYMYTEENVFPLHGFGASPVDAYENYCDEHGEDFDPEFAEIVVNAFILADATDKEIKKQVNPIDADLLRMHRVSLVFQEGNGV